MGLTLGQFAFFDLKLSKGEIMKSSKLYLVDLVSSSKGKRGILFLLSMFVCIGFFYSVLLFRMQAETRFDALQLF